MARAFGAPTGDAELWKTGGSFGVALRFSPQANALRIYELPHLQSLFTPV